MFFQHATIENTAPAANKPEKKQSRTKRRKLADSSSSGNDTEEHVPSASGNEQHINSGLTEAA